MTRMAAMQMAFVHDGCDELAMRDAYRLTHDSVIACVAGKPRGGVTWRTYKAAQGAKFVRAIDAYNKAVADPKLLEYLEAAPQGALIVATLTYEDGR